MKTFALAPIPGAAVLPAMEIIAGETGDNQALPLLSQRGIWGSEIARTLGLLQDLPVTLGPRGWQLASRPQASSRKLWRQWVQDLEDFRLSLDAPQQQDDSRPQTTLRISGPWTLAAALELPNGHRALTDAGACRDIRDCLYAQLHHLHATEFNYFVLSEPALAALERGQIPGAHDFETIPARNTEQMAKMLASFQDLPVALHTPRQVFAANVARLAGLPMGVFDAPQSFDTATLDSWGFALAQGMHPILLIDAKKPARETAIALARLVDELQLSRHLLTTATITTAQIDPELSTSARLLRRAVEVADILERDAGDL